MLFVWHKRRKVICGSNDRSCVKLIVIHCSATSCERDFSVDNLIATGNTKFGQPSYHWYVRRNGNLVPILPETVRGAHALNYNPRILKNKNPLRYILLSGFIYINSIFELKQDPLISVYESILSGAPVT